MRKYGMGVLVRGVLERESMLGSGMVVSAKEAE